jgi:predicted RNase H-like HicB family nuclease
MLAAPLDFPKVLRGRSSPVHGDVRAGREGGCIVTFPAVPCLATQGETLDEVQAMAADCLRAYLESLRKDGEPLSYRA